MKNSPNFAIFSIQLKTKTNSSLILEKANSFKFKHQKEQSNFFKDSHLMLTIILVTQIN